MKYIVPILVFMFFFSCNSRTYIAEPTGSDTTYLDSKGGKYKSLAQIPDTLRTPEQQDLISAINSIIIDYVHVKNNQMVLTITKKEFVAQGIPERYYHLLLQELRENNDFFESNGIKNVDEITRERREKYYRSLQK